MHLFGAGLTWATPTLDALGNVIANPTPLIFGTVQDVEIDVKFDLKELHGNKQFAVAVARGKAKVTGKIKHANIIASSMETIVFGQTGAGGLMAARNDTAGTTIAATVTVAIPGGGAMAADLGVINATTGLPFTRVASAPAAGQYSVAGAVYTFAAADVGKLAYINFRYTNTAAQAVGSRTISLKSLPMGYSPTFQLDQYCDYMGKKALFRFPNCVSEGMKFSFKNDDFTIPDLGFSVFADAGDNIGLISLTE